MDRSLPRGERARLLYPATITPHKNHEVVIRALHYLPDCEAVFTGAGSEALIRELRLLAQDLGVSDRVQFLGFVSEGELESQYQMARLLVMPSRFEAASGPVFEAALRQLPFVCAETPALLHQLKDIGIQAPTFAWDSPSGLARAVLASLADYDSRVAGLASVAATLAERTWVDTARDYARVLEWSAGSGPIPQDLRSE